MTVHPLPLTPHAPVLLESHPHVTTASTRSRDFQTRVGRPTHACQRDVPSGVLVFTRAVDREIDDLSIRLAAEGVGLVRVDADRCAGTALSWLPDAGIVLVDGEAFRPQLVWRRYFDPSSMDVDGDADTVAYVREQWRALAIGIGAPPVRSVNGSRRPAARDRIAQLHQARAVGLRVPATVVTSDLARAAALLPGDGDLLVKSVGRHCVESSPGTLRGIYPVRISRTLAAQRCVEAAPILVQDFVPSTRELRVYVVGTNLIGFAVGGLEPGSLWLEPDTITATRIEIDPQTRSRLLELSARLGLDVVAFDVLDTDDGPVFLEANAECDWLWVEHAARNADVSTAVRRYARSLVDSPSSLAPGRF